MGLSTCLKEASCFFWHVNITDMKRPDVFIRTHTHTNVYKYKCKRIENQFESKRLFICNPLQWKVTKKQPVHFVFYDYDLLYVFLCSFWEREREGENIVQKREFFFFPLKFIAHTVYLTFISRKHVYDKVAVVLRGKGGSASFFNQEVWYISTQKYIHTFVFQYCLV